MNALIPQPKCIEFMNRYVAIGRRGKSEIVFKDDLSLLGGKEALEQAVVRFIGTGFSTDGLFPVSIALCDNVFDVKNTTQAYRLAINTEGALITASGEAGARYALNTLIKLLEFDGYSLHLPIAVITDWPDFAQRGAFMEDWFGVDLMTLNDWKEMIDYYASLNFNHLNVGVYGCWPITHNYELTEFCFVPFEGHPELKKEQLIRYYSPKTGGFIEKTYLPPIQTENFLGEIIRYGQSRGMNVYPLFNSLGHNTLIPRTYPEVSAKRADGTPTGYGFCTSNDQTYTLLFHLFDHIIDCYLRPYGVDWFHIGLDEIWKAVGFDLNDALQETDPWCACEQCRTLTKQEIMMRHFIRCACHLKEKGIKHICIYYDYFEHFGLLNEDFVHMLQTEGLFENIVIDWWGYAEKLSTIFESTLPQLGLRRIMEPMTGFFSIGMPDSYIGNILSHARLGYAEGAEGIKAYSIFDYTFDRAYHCLSECAWNASGVPERVSFDALYASSRFPNGGDFAQEAMESYNAMLEPSPMGVRFETDAPSMVINNMANYYWYTFAMQEIEYPANFPGRVYECLLADKEKYTALLECSLADSTRARAAFTALAAAHQDSNPLITRHYITDAWHYETVARELLTMLRINERYQVIRCGGDGSLSEILAQLRVLITQRDALMKATEITKSAYLVPSVLRGMTIYREYLIYTLEFLSHAAESGTLPVWDLCDSTGMENAMYVLLHRSRRGEQ